jgi:hypothetical protein
MVWATDSVVKQVTDTENERNAAYLLKARTVEPERQPLLANGSETTSVSRQLSRKRQRNNARY